MKILYTGAFRFPDKDAASQRVLANAKILRNCGHEVIISGWEKEPRFEDINNSGTANYQGFRYYSQNELDKGIKNPFLKIFNFLFIGSNTIKWIKNFISKESIDLIIVYNSNSYFINSLHNLCEKEDIKLVADCTEWYEPEHLPGGKYGIVNMDNEFRINYIYPKVKNVIVISSFLEKYLNSKNCNTIVIPPLVDFDEAKWNLKNYNSDVTPPIKLIYAGEPGKKDILTVIFKVLSEINAEKKYIEFNILGVSEQSLVQTLGINTLPYFVNCLGRVQMVEVPKYYALSSFSIFVREQKRYANAGFSTKFVESLSVGVPVITNSTSDIPHYLVDGENGYLISDLNIEKDLKTIFEKILHLTYSEINIMKIKAKETSYSNFCYKKYQEPVSSYINQL